MSSGIGGGKGSSSSSTSSAAADSLANLAKQFAGETEGIRTGLIDAMQEVLSSGGSSVPIIARSVDASKQAASNALNETSNDLARSGLAGTPFGENIRASTRQSGEQSAALTGESMAQNIFSMISNFILGQSQTSTSGLAGAIPGMNTQNQSGKSLGFSI